MAAGLFALALCLTWDAGASEPPDPSLASRLQCESLTAEGKRSEAIMACTQALETLRSGANLRALVSALVDGPTPPTTTELSLALNITAHEYEHGGGLTAAAAACDIAERMGDMMMLQRCADELRATPDDPATRKALAILAARCPPWRFWGGWTLIAAAVLGTLAHAAGRARRRWSSAIPAAAAVSAALLASPATSRADDPPPVPQQHGWLSKWPIDDEHPEKSLPSEKERNEDPLQFGYWLQDLTWKAQAWSKRGNHVEAAKYYKVLTLVVPERAVGFVKTCEEDEAAGQIDQAIEMCGQALLRDGVTVGDYAHFVHLVLGQPRPLTEKEKTALSQVLVHMREDPAGHDAVDDLECQVGARTNNVAQLEECTAGLQARAPGDARTITYLWALAVAKGHPSQARTLLDRAKAAGVPPQELARMTEMTETSARWRLGRLALFALALAALLAAVIVAGRARLVRRRFAELR